MGKYRMGFIQFLVQGSHHGYIDILKFLYILQEPVVCSFLALEEKYEDKSYM